MYQHLVNVFHDGIVIIDKDDDEIVYKNKQILNFYNLKDLEVDQFNDSSNICDN